jgi:hypothetical protein
MQQRYLEETKLKVVVLLSRVERDKTLGEIAIPNCMMISEIVAELILLSYLASELCAIKGG